jgi:hypothetical protein
LEHAVATIPLLILASFIAGAAIGGVLVYMYLAARLEQEKQRLADDLHRIIEREERASRQLHRTAA